MDERPEACPASHGTALIRSGHACSRQRWKCKGPGCGRQFTRTTPRGKPVEVMRRAIEPRRRLCWDGWGGTRKPTDLTPSLRVAARWSQRTTRVATSAKKVAKTL